MLCKSLWIKASAKCINVNVNVNVYGKLRFGHLRDKTRLTLMYHVCKHHVSITAVLLLKDNLLKHVFGN